jgi:hypothetical protein
MVNKQSTGWVGWIFFASIMMMLAGGVSIVAGLTGIFNGDFYASLNGQLVVFDYTTWGWVHLLLGVGVILAGISLLAGKLWAQVAVITLAVLSAFGNIAFLPVYPWWSSIALVIDLLVIYAVTMHGDEVR